ncbi:dyslexia-associated protein KIAA0319-like isoform X2 [Pristis pectinata]|uniref:dyslexia-associated protein KIAA0319-like isoform X2 n=1 Tax=Pristis pectinata TaxID=685728 RepID=UPI00223CEA23|nr:dyslexia-associated protein KIAA0319-like isoform X2 [Pristis pectinata]
MIHLCFSLHVVLLCIITGTFSDYCSETVQYSNAVVSPNLKMTKILRVPSAVSMSECISACCDFPDCDLAWMFEGHCYIMSCQNEEECEPKKTSTMESYLTFVQRLSSQRSSIQEAPYKSRGYSMGMQEESTSAERDSNLEDLFAEHLSLDIAADSKGDYKEMPITGGSLQGSSKDQEQRHDSQSWLVWDSNYNLDVSPVTVGGLGDENEEVKLAGIHSGIPSDVTGSVSGSRQEEWHDETKEEANDIPTFLPLEVVRKENLQRNSNETNSGIQEEDVFPSNSSLPKPITAIPDLGSNGSVATHQERPREGAQVITPLSDHLLASQSAVTELPTVSAVAKQQVKELIVSAGTNVVITQPKNSVELNTFVLPAPSAESPYSYKWNLVNHPVDFEGLMEGEDSWTLKLSQLSEGLYVFRVTVSGDGAYGESFVNVTVEPATRINQSPVAIVSPEVQEVSLPTISTFIDGSRSTDDDRIVSYRWEEIKGPLREQKASGNTAILHLSNLVTGNYTFRLTVVDSDGVENSTTARVIVSKPMDYPPIANAGPNQVVTLPCNNITLNGNQSTDDHKIVSYEWSLGPNSKGKVVAMQGVRSPYLQLSAMQEGDYTFQLTVTDSAGQQSSAEVTVIVQPENNSPPVAIVGPDKELISPVESTSLNGEGSTDDQGIVSYHWEKISGSDVKIEGKDKAVATVLGLQVGMYQFRLTVTDQQGLNSSKTLAITIKEEINNRPVANAGGNHVLTLPNNSISLDGSKSTDDQAIASYLWTRGGQSPAAGEVIHGSDHDAVLQLANLVKGKYIFHLKVTDAKGESDTDSAIIEVRPDPKKNDLVELVLQVHVSSLSEQQKDTLVRQLAVLLGVLDEDINIQKIQAHSDSSTVLMFYVQGGQPDHVYKGVDVVRTLQKQLVREKVDFLLFKTLRIDTVVCFRKCSGHGHCDPFTKRCVCYPFWMENLMRRYFGDGESNCEWNILYVILSVFLTIIVIGGSCWTCIRCCKRKRTKVRKKNKYTILDNMDDQERVALRPKYGVKHKSTEHNSSLMISESEYESDQNTLFSRETIEKENYKVAWN